MLAVFKDRGTEPLKTVRLHILPSRCIIVKEPTAGRPPSRAASQSSPLFFWKDPTKSNFRYKNWNKRYFILLHIELRYNNINKTSGYVLFNTIFFVQMTSFFFSWSVQFRTRKCAGWPWKLHQPSGHVGKTSSCLWHHDWEVCRSVPAAGGQWPNQAWVFNRWLSGLGNYKMNYFLSDNIIVWLPR